MKAEIFIGVCVCFVLCGCVDTHQKKTTLSNQEIPVIDLTKDYPEKEFVADEADKEYVVLETTDEVLAANDFSIKYVSDQRIVGMNFTRGDIFIFDGNGKVVSSFNHKGGSNNEYTYLFSVVFDEKAKEVFVSDMPNKNRCLVYSEDGKYLRQFNYPDSSWVFGELYDFDAQTLLIYNEYRQELSIDEINQKTPYVFLSKKEGSVVSRLDDLSFAKRVSNRKPLNLGDRGMTMISVSIHGNMKYGPEFIIADKSSDTVFVLTQDKKLTPLFVRTPTVFADENKLTLLAAYFKTDTYLFLNTLTYDWDEIIAQVNRGQMGLSSKTFAYDLRTGQVYSVNKVPSVSIIDASGKAAVNWIGADRLIDRLEEGTLDGKLKQIAQKIDADDNPVVEIVRYK